MTSSHLDTIWRERPSEVRKYYELLPLHERLCSEVAFTLQHLLKDAEVEFAHVTSRAKCAFLSQPSGAAISKITKVD